VELWGFGSFELLKALSLKALGFLFFGTYASPQGVYIDWVLPGSNDMNNVPAKA
jgi:hypothetical protein